VQNHLKVILWLAEAKQSQAMAAQSAVAVAAVAAVAELPAVSWVQTGRIAD
jgi:hypothetical protein